MKKNYALILILIGFFSLKSSAQESIIGDINYNKLDQYIQAAKEYYPRRKVFEQQRIGAKVNVTTTTISYLDLFSANYFYRPNDKQALSAPGNTTNPYIVNGIQYGITLNLANFLQKPFLVKKAKAELKVAELQAQDYDITLVSEVKKRYYLYVQMQTELKIRTQTAQENRGVADNARNRFEKGEISIDQYNASRVIFADSNTNKIATEVNYLNAKDALEEIIGKKLSDFK